MARYRVLLTESKQEMYEVEAGTEMEAEDKAIEGNGKLVHEKLLDFVVDVTKMQGEGEAE